MDGFSSTDCAEAADGEKCIEPSHELLGDYCYVDAKKRKRRDTSDVDNSQNFVCHCELGFYGDDCGMVDPCSANPCQNGGRCLKRGLSN